MIQALAYGTLRQLGYLQFVQRQLAPRTPKNTQLSALLWVALHQLARGEAAYAVVDGAVDAAAALAGNRHKAFVNAVLRNYLRQRAEIDRAASADDEARFSYPRWWIDKLRSQLGAAAEAVLDAGNLHPPMTLRINLRRIDPEHYRAKLAEHAIACRSLGATALLVEPPCPVEALPGFSDGLVSVQDAGAQLAAPMLDARAGQRVLDACAAPGGKSAHLLEQADIALTAVDIDPERLQRVADNLRRLGLSATLLRGDAGEPAQWWDGRPYDRILLDAPCSASGVVRRHPDVKWLRRQADIGGFAGQQRRLLDAVWKLLSPGGKLLYVTCSIFCEENQHQVEAFLSRHGDARLLQPPASGLLLPNPDHDGFYHALIAKG